MNAHAEAPGRLQDCITATWRCKEGLHTRSLAQNLQHAIKTKSLLIRFQQTTTSAQHIVIGADFIPAVHIVVYWSSCLNFDEFLLNLEESHSDY